MPFLPNYLKNKRNVLRWLLLFVLVNLIVLYTYKTFADKMFLLDDKLSRLRSEMVKYGQIGNEVKAIREELRILEIKTKVIAELEELRDSTAKRLSDVINTLLGKKIRLEKLIQDQYGISIDGHADEADALVQAKDTLKTLEWVDNAGFSISPRLLPNNTGRIGFHIEIPAKQKKLNKTMIPSKRKKRKSGW